MSLFKAVAEAHAAHNLSAEVAYAIYRSHCEGNPPARVPGMDTVLRLAVRIASGKTVQEAAAREYLYRWSLAIKAPDQCGATGEHDWRGRNTCVSVFGCPHTIGM